MMINQKVSNGELENCLGILLTQEEFPTTNFNLVTFLLANWNEEAVGMNEVHAMLTQKSYESPTNCRVGNKVINDAADLLSEVYALNRSNGGTLSRAEHLAHNISFYIRNNLLGANSLVRLNDYITILEKYGSPAVAVLKQAVETRGPESPWTKLYSGVRVRMFLDLLIAEERNTWLTLSFPNNLDNKLSAINYILELGTVSIDVLNLTRDMADQLRNLNSLSSLAEEVLKKVEAINGLPLTVEPFNDETYSLIVESLAVLSAECQLGPINQENEIEHALAIISYLNHLGLLSESDLNFVAYTRAEVHRCTDFEDFFRRLTLAFDLHAITYNSCEYKGNIVEEAVNRIKEIMLSK